MSAIRFITVALILTCTLPLVRSAEGDLDPTFNPGAGANGVVISIVPLRSGQILVAGLFTTFNGISRHGLARLNSDGSLDGSFAPVIDIPDQGGIATLLVDTSDRIYAGGLFTRVGGVTRHGMARLNPNGTLDTSFVPDLPDSTVVAALELTADATGLLVGGSLVTASGSPDRAPGFGITKLQAASGAREPSFSPPEMNAYDYIPIVYKIRQMPDGRILLGGEFTDVGGQTRNNICQLHADGSVDPSFAIGTPLVWTQVNDIDVDAAGRIYLSGDFVLLADFQAGCVARLNSDGAIDRTFTFPATSTSDGSRPIVNNLQILADGRLLAVGNFRQFNGTPRTFIVRTSANGTLDASYSSSPDQEIVALAEDGDGRSLIGGYFSAVNQSSAPGLARLMIAGDAPTITPFPFGHLGIPANNNVILTAPIADASSIQWLLNGQPIDGATRTTLALPSVDSCNAGVYTVRANGARGSVTSNPVTMELLEPVAGSPDVGFPTNLAPFNGDYAIAHTPDDTWCSVLNGPSPKLTRYDSLFVPKSTVLIQGFSACSAKWLKTDQTGRVWMGGTFTLSSGGTRYFVRLTTDGVYDPDFNPTATAPPNKIVINDDGSVLVLDGGISIYDSSLRKLLSDGTLDPSFSTRGSVSSFVVQSDGGIVYGWNQSTGISLTQIARLAPDGTSDSSFSAPIVTGTGRRGSGYILDAVYDIALMNNGEIAILAGSSFADLGYARLGPTGNLITSYSFPSTERFKGVLCPPDRAGGIMALCAGTLTRFTATGDRDRTFGSGLIRSVDDTWVSDAQGILLKCSVAKSDNYSPDTITSFYRFLAEDKGDFRLVNLSGRGVVGTGESALIVGYVTTGTSGQILMRGIGPTLRSYGVSDAQDDTAIQLYQAGTMLQSNDNWTPDLGAVFQRTGAFALDNGSRDAALAPTLAGGVYTAIMQPVSAAGGIGLGEIYDASDGSIRLRNVSIRGRVEGGEKVLIGGFVVNGTGPRWVLIRAVGPELGPLGVSQPLTDPRLALRRGSTTIATNDTWFSGTDGLLAKAAARKVGAFPVPTTSTDAALYVRLNPGLYSAAVSSGDGTAGIALLEIYALGD